jgi:uncharacterized protein (DUF362 family)/Pyruvate/2-oxoacid:ferredoxin oxidoreductase delta subunit
MSEPTSAQNPAARVAAMRCPAYDLDVVRDAVRRCVDALPDLAEKFQRAGRVLVKPNLLSSTHGPDAHTNTHPAVVHAVAELLITEFGCDVSVGDSCGTLTPGGTAQAIRRSGIEDVCNAVGAHVYNVDTQPRHVVAFERGGVWKQIPLPSNLDDFDLIVSLAKLKTHSLTGVTGPVKNIFGLVPGAAKKEAHMLAPRLDRFAALLCDLYDCVRPGAAFVDGIVGMEGRGPSGGALKRVELIGASADPVALDAYCADVMGMDPMRIPLLADCAARRLGTAALDRIEVIGEPARAFAPDGFAPPPTFASGLLLRIVPRWVTRGLFRSLTSRYAQIAQSRCIQCGECARNCPSHTIAHDASGNRYHVLRKGCISCYCCAEACPVAAIDILPTLPVRIVGRLRHPFRGRSPEDT